MRVLLDTSVWVSALLWPGLPHQLLKLIETGEIIPIISPALVEELRGVLGRPKFASILTARETDVAELMQGVLRQVELYDPSDVSGVVARDPDDDAVIACAVAGQALWIISGDAHLLDLDQYRNIQIGSPRRFLEVEFPTHL